MAYQPGRKRPKDGMTAEKFWSKVDRSAGDNGCWPWTAGRHKKGGYGLCAFEARNCLAHRIAVMFSTGVAVPGHMVVMHTCDNPPCCNPAHLRVATQAENMADARRKGIAPPPVPQLGEKHHSAKLTDEKVREIRASTETYNVLAARYGVCRSTIEQIRYRNLWRHVQ